MKTTLQLNDSELYDPLEVLKRFGRLANMTMLVLFSLSGLIYSLAYYRSINQAPTVNNYYSNSLAEVATNQQGGLGNYNTWPVETAKKKHVKKRRK